MRKRKWTIFMTVAFLMVLSACAPAQAESVMMEKPTEAMMEKPTEAMMEKPTEAMMEKPTEAMMEKPTEAMMEKPTEAMMEKPTEAMMEKPTEAMMEKPTEAMMEKPTEAVMMDAPAWLSATLMDVNTGKNFRLSDFKGKVILVETMAMWCPTCLRQQKEVKALHEKLGMDEDLVSIALDIDPNENGEALKGYAAENGFEWLYAVSPVEVSRELGNLYGAQFLNPPSAPILVIDRHGVVHPLPFGLKSAEDLLSMLQPLLDAGM